LHSGEGTCTKVSCPSLPKREQVNSAQGHPSPVNFDPNAVKSSGLVKLHKGLWVGLETERGGVKSGGGGGAHIRGMKKKVSERQHKTYVRNGLKPTCHYI